MKFCNKCGNFMRPNADKELLFICLCGNTTKGDANDTLIEEGFIETTENLSKYIDIIENAANDAAGYRVEKKCDKCNLDYMTLVRLGEQNVVIYVCKCGNIIQ